MPGLDRVDTVAGFNEEAARCVYAKYASISLHISNCESEWQRGNSPPVRLWLTQWQPHQAFDSLVVPSHLCVLVSWGGTRGPPSQLADERCDSTSCCRSWPHKSSDTGSKKCLQLEQWQFEIFKEAWFPVAAFAVGSDSRLKGWASGSIISLTLNLLIVTTPLYLTSQANLEILIKGRHGFAVNVFTRQLQMKIVPLKFASSSYHYFNCFSNSYWMFFILFYFIILYLYDF